MRKRKKEKPASIYTIRRSFWCQTCKRIKFHDHEVADPSPPPKKCQCGGKMVESKSSAKKMKDQRPREEKKKEKESETVRCKGCGRRFQKGGSIHGHFLAVHLSSSNNSECRDLYEQDGFYVVRDEKKGCILVEGET
jgi:uncharacterized protein with PIN domain